VSQESADRVAPSPAAALLFFAEEEARLRFFGPLAGAAALTKPVTAFHSISSRATSPPPPLAPQYTLLLPRVVYIVRAPP
jgi:hypothetical protein